MERLHGILLLSVKRPRRLGRWENAMRRCFREPFKGPIIPFGAMVEYHPTSPKDQARIHQFGKKVLSGIFLGHELIAGCGRLRKVGCIRYLCSKNQRNGSVDQTKRW